jgi:predicted AAA+ superfamily ATPase
MYTRPILKIILDRLKEPKIQILLGARQVGKTTLILQALNKVDLPSHYAIAETGYNASWIEQQWSIAIMKSNGKSSILVIDEIQKIPNWSERVKRLYDENIINSQKIHLVVLGSSSLSLQKGLTESMAGRFEVIYIPHWSFSECEEAFGMSLDEYIFYGGYPGSIVYKSDEERFFSYIQESIIEPVVSRDILSQNIINKPSLLRELFRLGSEYSGQILSFNKMLGQLQDAGNTTTLSHYLTLLDQSFVLRGIYKYSNKSVLRRQSPPKLQIYNMALQTASYRIPFENIMSNPDIKGRLVESCVGAYLLSNRNAEIFYWRDDNKEVDFIVRYKGKIIAIEVKSGKKYKPASGLESFSNSYQTDRKILVGSGGVPLELFLKNPIDAFL